MPFSYFLNRSSSSRRSSNAVDAVAALSPANPLPPPPPYTLVDRPGSSAATRQTQGQVHTIAEQQAARQQYMPPAGSPPLQPQHRHHNQNPISSATNVFKPSNQEGPISSQNNNPFANSSPPPVGFPNQLASSSSSSPLARHPSSSSQHSAIPFSSSPRQTPIMMSSAAPQPKRQASVTEHVRRMSQDLAQANLQPQVSSLSSGAKRAATIHEDPFDFLHHYDTIFIIDDSASMQVNEMPDGSIGKSRWEEARDAVCGVIQLASKYDDDGLDVYFLNDERCIENCTDPRQVLALFDSIQPHGTTPIGTRLEILLLDYMDRIEMWKDKTAKSVDAGSEPKKRNYIIITDGSPTDDPESVIVTCARRLDQRNFPLAQIGIQFIQVGNDAEASEALEELDDALSKEHGIRDMVDTLTYQSMVLDANLIIKALLGGINRRLDRKKDRSLRS